MLTLNKTVLIALARQRRVLRKQLAEAEKQKQDSDGVLWERAESIQRKLRTIKIMIEEWKYEKRNK